MSVLFGKQSVKPENSLMANKFVEYRNMLIHFIHDRTEMTDVISTRNPLNINVNTQNIAATKLAMPKKKRAMKYFELKDLLPKTSTLAETMKHSDEAQMAVLKMPKKKIKNLSAVR